MNYDLVVVGGGAGGLSAARSGVRIGKRTALIQDGPLGGDCTFTGCVPSKSLIEDSLKGIDFGTAFKRMNAVIDQIAQSESAEVLKRENVDVIEGRAAFRKKLTLSVDSTLIDADHIVIATGSRAAVPNIKGINQVNYLTNETVFKLTSLPSHLIIIGGGAIGCELAQVFNRFGTRVQILEGANRLLPREEVEASKCLEQVFKDQGIAVKFNVQIQRVETMSAPEHIRVVFSDDTFIDGDSLLVAVGRKPTTDDLGSTLGEIVLDDRGYIKTDNHLQTSSPGVYAIGDVTGLMPFTHVADEMGRIAVRNAFSKLGKQSFESVSIPRVTYTDPEVASIGLNEAEASKIGGRIAYLPMEKVDRAILANRTEGFVKLIAAPRKGLGNLGGGKLIGATIVSPRAGELIHEIALVMRANMFAGRLAQTVHAYPSWSTAIRQAAAQFFYETDGLTARKAQATPQ